MKISLSPEDYDCCQKLETIRRNNFDVLTAFADYLSNSSQFITSSEIDALVREFGMNEEQAFRTLLASFCGFDDEKGRTLVKKYFIPSIKKMDPVDFENDSCYRFFQNKNFKSESWELKQAVYKPYEAFVRDDLFVADDFTEIPRLGFFDREYYYPTVLQNGREWMTITPNETATMRGALQACRGRTAVYGLGLGYFAFKAAEKPETEFVAVIEKDPDLVSLFSKRILPDMPFRDKIVLYNADAFEYAQRQAPKERYDFSFVDLWHDLGDGIEPYLRMKKIERQQKVLDNKSGRINEEILDNGLNSVIPARTIYASGQIAAAGLSEFCEPSEKWAGTRWCYWIESTLLSHLRWSFWSAIKRAMVQEVCLPMNLPINSFDDIRKILSDDYLKNSAADRLTLPDRK